jgi:predicted CoA-binding protein
MECPLPEFLDKKNIFAVVGVSSNSEKYGYKVFFKLLNAGYHIYAVHPEGGHVETQKRYTTLKDLPQKPDVVSLVVAPSATEEIVKECKQLHIDKIWMQPGSESQKSIQYCHENHIKVIHDLCIILNTET